MKKIDLRTEFIKKLATQIPTTPPREFELSGNVNYTDWLENKICEYIDVHHGLYAIDFEPNKLLYKFIESQSDACQLKAEDAEQLQIDWEAWLNNKNLGESPFIQISFSKNEETLINRVNDMCIESLDPETYQKWEEVKEIIFNTRKFFRSGA